MLLSSLKKVAKTLMHRCGYGVIKLPGADSQQSYPYVRRYKIDGIRFDFWIANECGAAWYDHGNMACASENFQLRRLVQPGERVLEIGSHHGFFTMLLARSAGPQGFVVAVEAEAQNAMIAQAQLGLNEMGGYGVVLHRAGSDRSGELKMSTTDGSNAYAVARDEQGYMSVPACTGDELASKYGPFDLLKIDVEGYEEKVLAGCREILKSRPKLAIELHLSLMSRYDTSVEEILQMIHVEDYEGTMFLLPDSETVLPFDAGRLGNQGSANVFLRPKSTG